MLQLSTTFGRPYAYVPATTLRARRRNGIRRGRPEEDAGTEGREPHDEVADCAEQHGHDAIASIEPTTPSPILTEADNPREQPKRRDQQRHAEDTAP